MQHTPDSLWLTILEELGETALNDIYLRQATPHTLTEESFIIAVPSDYTQNEIEDRFLSDIKKVLGDQTKNGCKLQILVDKSLAKTPETEKTVHSSEEDTPETANLNPNYVFDNFVVGQSNRICHATAFAASDDLGGEYNPLFIYGGVGLGKTHLLHAIGNRVQDITPKRKVLYVTSETFMNEFIESIFMNRNSAQGFRTKYRTADLLLIDDIQFLARKEGTQEEFFNTFNDLYMNSNQIVMTSDRSPSMLENLEERLSSRFEWGMVAEIDKPNYELRLSILRRKCQDQKFEEISDEVLSYIAEMVTANIRELEGILVRLTTQASILDERLDIDFARRVLNDTTPISRGLRQKVITAEAIQKVVADHFQLSSDDLTSVKRTKVLVFPRQIAMYLCRELTQLSLLDIADAFNRQNHRTITYAYEQVEKLLEDKEIKKLVQLLTDELT